MESSIGIPRPFATHPDMEIAVFLSRVFAAMGAAGHGKAQLQMIQRSVLRRAGMDSLL
jgi:hypothetical protein